MEILSIFEVVDYKTREEFREDIVGCGEDIVKQLRKDYPRHSKFVLIGFEVEGNFKPLNLRTNNYIR